MSSYSLCISSRLIAQNRKLDHFCSKHFISNKAPFSNTISRRVSWIQYTPISRRVTTECSKNSPSSETKPAAIQLPKISEGVASLLLVSLLWGSYTPVLRGIFTTPDAPAPLFVAAARGILQMILLGIATSFQKNDDNVESTSLDSDTNRPQHQLKNTIMASLEIGTCNTCGTLLQTWGLSMTTATRGAFLIQATSLFTPILAAVFGMAPSRALWISSFVAFLATVFVALDQILGVAATTSTTSIYAALDSTISHVLTKDGGSSSLLVGLSLGDLATLGAAFCYSLSTVRIPIYTSKSVSPLGLALGKSSVLAFTSCLLVVNTLLHSTAQPVTADLWSAASWNNTTVWSLIAFSAIGPGALGAYFHVKGQSLVGPTEAQLVFSTVPLWSAVLAAAFLPGENVGTLSWIGGGCMVAAGLIAAIPQQWLQQQQQERRL